MFLSVKVHTAEMRHAIHALGKGAPPAMARAANRAITTTRAFMAREISTDTGLKVGTVKEQLRIEKAAASQAEIRARLIVTGKRIPLIDFKAKGPFPSRGRGRGVTARLPGTRRYPNAFIARMRSGHLGVFQRTGKGRLPIYELFGPSLPFVFAKHSSEALQHGEESLQKNLAHELRFALQKAS